MGYLADASATETWIIVLAWLAVAIAIAAVSGVFVPQKIHGPERWSPGEPPGVFLAVCAYGLLGFIIPELFYQFILGKSVGKPVAPPPNIALILNCLSPVMALVAMLVGSKLIRPEGNRRLGFSLKNIPRGLAAGLVGIIVAWPIVQLTGDVSEFVLQHLHKPHPDAHELLLAFRSAKQGWVRWMIIVSAVVIAPIAEETFFRAFFQTWLRVWLNRPWIAVVISAALFAAAHEWWTQPSIFIFGLCLGYLYERTGNLWANIFLHAFFNAASVTYFWYMAMHGG